MNNEKRYKVLVVDDQPLNLKLVATVLNKDYNLVFANNGEKALISATETNPDLILLDIMMPDMDGIEVCKRLKQNEKTKDIPVIFLTARNEESDIVKGFEVGGVDYIKKPFLPNELMSRIKTHIELKVNREKLIELNKDLDKFNKRIKEELEFTAELQKYITIPEKLNCGGIDIYSKYIPCDEMAGDYINYFEKDDNLYLLSADVSGHGLLASFYSFIINSLLTSISDRFIKLEEIIDFIADRIRPLLVKGNFFTFSLIKINKNSGEGECIIAGHPDFIIKKSNGEFLEFKSSNLFINVIKISKGWNKYYFKLEKDDIAILTTDGIIEILNDNNVQLGKDFLKEEMKNFNGKNYDELLNIIVEKAKKWGNIEKFRDDVSIAIIVKN